jgi:hypothetical protein
MIPGRLAAVVTTALAGVLASAAQVPRQMFVPDPGQPSDLRVMLDPVGAMPSKINPTSPAVAGSTLLLIDQGGSLFAWDGKRASPILSKANLPAGVKLAGAEPLMNAAANAAGTTVYVMFISSTAPKDAPKRMSPRDPDAWYLLYAFDFDGTSLTHPRAITAMQERTDGHSGGGLIVLPDGAVLFAAGDNGDSYEDGRENGQNPAHHLAKLVRIDPATGETTVVALGVRACQRLTLDTFDGEPRLTFVDPGGWVSEELDSIRLADLAGPVPPNFGWGRAADHRSREGSFYIDTVGNSSAKIPADEPGFVSPLAEVGRGTDAPFAISGPVHSVTSLPHITFLFADLVGGAMFAVTGGPAAAHAPVFTVQVLDAQRQPTTLKDLAGGQRPDPRFFTFPDGTAGVLLERTGTFYRITEVN